MPKHQDSRILPYTARQMFDLVADVERYPEFLPWNSAARIRSREALEGEGAERIEADLVISFKVFRERFGSRVLLYPQDQPLWIETDYLDGPFRHLHSTWRFTDLPPEDEELRCKVAFDVDFEFRNPILGRLIGAVFGEAMARIIRAFEDRARALYGAGGSR
ncbi:type II toxin-antitoxin system RatA family toxin [Paracoccus sp. TK19116]|uniref:Type II toxin-antitoxin system RatA family toxin n=1 Tax=Paracoccus albicereus TaxID=2922394 RepID=A0ABT1MN20_9RHOB|nr:type II toxin-antitoxin system RatA family toxin [Paracoccus albicereus]MCQ0969667.1 type II toxin-antitoxin system RatA family toxin [Paracoccus albicereus]